MGRPRIVEGGVLLPLSPANGAGEEGDDDDLVRGGADEADEDDGGDASSHPRRGGGGGAAGGPAGSAGGGPRRRCRRRRRRSGAGPLRTATTRTAAAVAAAAISAVSSSSVVAAGAGRSHRGGGGKAATAATATRDGDGDDDTLRRVDDSTPAALVGRPSAAVGEGKSGVVMEFPRRYPRIGNAFQAKSIPSLMTAAVVVLDSTAQAAPQPTAIHGSSAFPPASCYASSRPQPLRFSTEFPHCTVEQVESYENGPEDVLAADGYGSERWSPSSSSPTTAVDDAEASASGRMGGDGDDAHVDVDDGTPSPATTAGTAATAASSTTTTTPVAAAEAEAEAPPSGMDHVNEPQGSGSTAGEGRPGHDDPVSAAENPLQEAFVSFVAPIFLYEEKEEEGPGGSQPMNDSAEVPMPTEDDRRSHPTQNDPLKQWVWRVVDWHQDRLRPASANAADRTDDATGTSSSGRRLKSRYRTLPLAAAASSSSLSSSRHPTPPGKRDRPTTYAETTTRPAKRYKGDDPLRAYWRQHSGIHDAMGAPTTTARRHGEDGSVDLWQQRACHVALVNLCGGQARTAFRHAKRSRALVTAGNPSWRDAVAISAPVAYGDYRRYQHPPLAYAGGRRDPSLMSSSAASAALEWAESKTCTHNATIPEWKALLALGQNVLDDLTTTKLSEVTQFCLGMSRVFLPPPDTTDLNRQMDAVMEQLVGAVETCRSDQAYVVDAMFSDPDDLDDDGVDTEELQRLIDAASESAPCVLDWADEQRRMVDDARAWEDRVEQCLVAETAGVGAGGELEELEQLVQDAKHSLSFRTTSLVELEQRLDKAYELRSRIRSLLDNNEAPEPLKTLGSIVRDATKLRVTFAEIRRLVEFHTQAEAWVDRANVAIRSRISLSEIKALLRQANELPVDLSEYTEKLLTRERVADEWILRFSNIVPNASTMQQMSFVRRLMDNKYSLLHELASDGSRIPVEVETVSWLQVELDGRNWSLKTKKIIPGYHDSKKGRLEELHEHLSKAVVLRDRLTNVLSEEQKQQWCLDGEPELRSLVADAERWFAENKDFIDGDNRKTANRPSLSIPKLRQIVETGNAIYAHLGSALTKVSRILLQAEDWLGTYQSLVTRCATGEQVEVSELMSAVSAANSDVALDLHEALELNRLSAQAQAWFEAAEVACGRRKPSRHKKGLTIEVLKELIEEAKHLPVDTREFEQELLTQLQLVEDWQARSVADVENIVTAFEALRNSLREVHGEPANFECTSTKRMDSSDESEVDGSKGADDETVSSSPCSADQIPNSSTGESNVASLVSRFLKDSQSLAIRTPECDVAQEVDAVCKWLAKSVKYLESHRDVFDRRFFGAFDRSMAEAKELLDSARDATLPSVSPAIARLKESVVGVVTDQEERLRLLLQERERYAAWCNMVNAALEDGKLTIERLRDIAKESRGFPVACDTTRKVQRLEEKALQWVEFTRQQLESQDKMPLQEAKSLLDEGEKIGVVSGELKTLRNTLKAANAWANRVRRCKPESGKQNSKSIQELLDEHETLHVCMPEEVKKLRKALKAFCICRRPYDGFMVGCDSCDDWFHGPCIGISESKAEKVDKYECVRCLLVKLFNTSASTIAGVIRKWTNVADCRKSRQVGSQKLQRKLRKELKEMEELNERREVVKEEIRLAKSDLAPAPMAIVDGIGVLLPVSESADPPVAVGEAVPQPLLVDASAEGPTSSNDPSPEVERTTVSVESLELKLAALEKSLVQSETRLAGVHDAIARRRNEEEIEDANADLLRRFCVVVRTLVLIPSTPTSIDAGHPSPDGDLSSPMTTVIEQAQAAGLERFQDVRDVINAFRCMCWSYRANTVVSKHPQFDDVHSLVRRAADSSMRLPDEKAFRMLRGMTQRAAAWQIRAMKAIAPSPGEVRPYDLNHLRELAKLAEDIPLCMPFEARLAATLDDDGHRHCVCGGPSDGRVMLSCDACERWFHCSCVGLSKDALSELGHWECPKCSGVIFDPAQVRVEEFHNQFDCSDEATESDDDSSTQSVERRDLWPPFGLLGSERSLNAIGKTACDIPPLFHIEGPGAPSPNPAEQSPRRGDPPVHSSPAPQPTAVLPPHMYSPPHHFFSVAAGPYASLHPGSPPSFAPSQAPISTPPRAPSNHPVVFGSPGVTVLSPGTLAGAAGPHAHHAVYAGSPPAFVNVAHYPHATHHPLFHVGHAVHPFHAALLTGYPANPAPEPAHPPPHDVGGPDGRLFATQPCAAAATATEGRAAASIPTGPAAEPSAGPDDRG